MTVKKSAVFVGFADSVWSLQNPPGGTRHHAIDDNGCVYQPLSGGAFFAHKKAPLRRGFFVSEKSPDLPGQSHEMNTFLYVDIF